MLINADTAFMREVQDPLTCALYHFKTNEEVGSLYSVEDLLKVGLLNDDLSTVINNWESVMSGLSHTPDETTLRDILLSELRPSKRLKYDLEIYDRAREGTEQHIYRFLMDSLKELLTRERKRKNRDRIARSHGDKYGAAASTSPGRTSSPSGRGGRSQSPRPRSPGTYALNPQSPETLDGWFSKLGSILRSPN